MRRTRVIYRAERFPRVETEQCIVARLSTTRAGIANAATSPAHDVGDLGSGCTYPSHVFRLGRFAFFDQEIHTDLIWGTDLGN